MDKQAGQARECLGDCGLAAEPGSRFCQGCGEGWDREREIVAATGRDDLGPAWWDR